jgi:peptidoglycan-N-acetylglucosamine deacetylase
LSKRHKFVVFALFAALVSGIAAWRISKARCFQLVGEFTCRVETDEKIVALSFDDGPTPEGVDVALAQLEPRGIKATFFLIGNRMEKWPGEARRLVEAGHELGNHSFTHTRMIGKLAASYDAEIARTDRMLKVEGAKQPTLFRPPFGKRLIGLPLAVERAGYHTIMWDVEDDAEHFPDPKAYAADILARVRPGSIILIHPMYRNNQTAREALPLVLDGLKAKGYHVVPVGELLAVGRQPTVEDEK